MNRTDEVGVVRDNAVIVKINCPKKLQWEFKANACWLLFKIENKNIKPSAPSVNKAIPEWVKN